MARLLVLISACLALVGCATQKVDPKSLHYQKCNNPNQCTIEIRDPTCDSFGRCTAWVSIYALLLDRGKPHNIIWTLPAGFGFCDTARDGAWLTKVDPFEQFEKPRAEKPSGTGP
jgi:hypothetical protein